MSSLFGGEPVVSSIGLPFEEPSIPFPFEDPSIVSPTTPFTIPFLEISPLSLDVLNSYSILTNRILIDCTLEVDHPFPLFLFQWPIDNYHDKSLLRLWEIHFDNEL